jgi:hypothetical protein
MTKAIKISYTGDEDEAAKIDNYYGFHADNRAVKNPMVFVYYVDKSNNIHEITFDEFFEMVEDFRARKNSVQPS